MHTVSKGLIMIICALWSPTADDTYSTRQKKWRRYSRRKSEGFFWESKVSSEEAESFFRRALGSYTHRFPKRGAASLTDLPGLRLRLLELRLCLPSCVSNGKAA